MKRKSRMIQKIYLTSDEHYNHQNILGFTKRGEMFSSIQEMNDALIKAHNSIVKDCDLVYHLGDLTFKNIEYAVSVLKQLNGTHCLIRGNHDYWLEDDSQNGVRALQSVKDEFTKQGSDPNKIMWIKDYFEMKNKYGHFCLNHFPMLTWHKSYRGSVSIHGHTHASINHLNDNTIKRLDVGVDSAFDIKGNYEPFSLEEIVHMMKDRQTIVIDVHK